MSSDRTTGRWRRFAAAFAALAVGVATTIAVAPTATAIVTGTWETTATVTGADQTDGLTVSVAGTGYTGLPNASTGSPAAGVYAAIYDSAGLAAPAADNALAQAWVTPGQISAGAWSTSLTVPFASLDADETYTALVWVAHGNPTADTILFQQAVTLTTAQHDELFPKVWEPQIQVFLNGGATPVTAGTAVYDGDVLTVKGTGFDPDANVSTRPPIPVGQPTGDYVIFGDFASTWQPSAGAASSTRKVADQKWAAPYSPSVLAGNAQYVPLSDDGAFTANLTVKATTGGTGTYGIFTYAAGGAAANASQELELRLDYRGARPSITLSKSTNLDPAGDTIHVTGAGFGPNANGTFPPVAGHPAGFYVALGKYADPWKPSEGAPSANRKNGAGGQGLWWVVTQDTYDYVESVYGPAGTTPNPGIFSQYVVMDADGSFELDLTVAAVQGGITESTPGTYGVYTYGAAGQTGADFETFTPITFAGTGTPGGDDDDEDPISVDTTVTVTSANTASGLTLTVSGTGYTSLPDTSTGNPAAGVYLALYDANTSSPADLTASAQGLASNFVPNGSIAGGAWTATLTAASSKLTATGDYRVVTWSAHGLVTDETLLDDVAVTLTPTQLEALGLTGSTTTPTTPTTPGGGTPVPRSTSASVNATSTGFSIQVSGVGYSATDLPNGVYAALYDASKGGPEQMNAGQSGIATAWVQSVASGSWSTTLTVSASAISSSGSYYVAVWPGHTEVSGGNIIANIAVSLSGAAGGDEQGGTSGASAAVTEVDLAKDRTQTITGSGFTPGETVQGTLHSDVVDLGTKVADAGGKVTFTFQIPVGFEVGSHTVVLKGATSGHSVTAAFTVTDSAAPTTGTTATKSSAAASTRTASILGESEICTEETVPGTASTPRLNWGVKSSFISYIQSGVANGTIAPAGGAAKAGDSFTWGAGSGSLDAQGNGTLTFPGSLHITAHGGVLDLSISNLKVTAKGKTGTLTATIKSQDMQGNPVPVGSVVLADLSFSSLSATGGKATAKLTAAGAKAFAGFYQAGEQLDPITVSFAGGSDATTRTVCRDASGNIVGGAGAEAAPGLASTGVPMFQQLGLAVLLLLAGAGAVVLAARRRESRAGSHL